MKLLPKKTYQLPYYIGVYWVGIWIVISMILFISLTTITKNGFITKKDCLKENAQRECVLYSRNYKVRFDEELKLQIVAAGIIIGATILIGGFGVQTINGKGNS